MTPERMARLVARWVRLYTGKLPTAVAQRRSEEIEADLHDHIAHERAHGTSDRRIALSIASRMVRGLAADAAWRGRHAGRSTIVVLASACILLLPLLAMQVTDAVAWGVADFVFAGALLVGTGLLYPLATRKSGNLAYRAAAGVALAAAFILIFAVAGLGVIGETGDPADLMYGGVLAVGIIGAVSARFEPLGMSRTLLAMALAQSLVAVIALIAGKHEAAISSVSELLGLNGFFAALFVGSAWLFRRAGRTRPTAEARSASRPGRVY